MQFKTPRTLELEARLRRLRERMHDHLERCHDLNYDPAEGYLDLMGQIDTAARDVSWVAPCFMPSWRNKWYRKRQVENWLTSRGVSRKNSKIVASFMI